MPQHAHLSFALSACRIMRTSPASNACRMCTPFARPESPPYHVHLSFILNACCIMRTFPPERPPLCQQAFGSFLGKKVPNGTNLASS